VRRSYYILEQNVILLHVCIDDILRDLFVLLTGVDMDLEFAH